MRLDRRFVIVVGFSLLWALLVSAVFHRVAGAGSRHLSRGPEKTLVVASKPLPLGAVIDAASIKITRVPEDLFPKGGFSKAEDAIGRPVVSPIDADEPVLEARTAPRGSGQGLAPMIPTGMRAMAVRVNDVVGVAGFVLPGMRVDVLVTGRPPGHDDTITSTVLQNVPVLSAGQTIQVDARSQSISVPVVTLLVTPGQAEALTLANNEGHIQLVLRNSGDQQVNPTAGRALHELYALERASAPAPSAAAPKPAVPRKAAPEPVRAPPLTVKPAVDEVVILVGDKKTVESFPPNAPPK